MTEYEVLYILSPKLEDAARDELIERFKSVVTSAGGSAEAVKWGVRKLAYRINFMNEGFYVLMNFTAPEDIPAELERQMRITDAVMRFIVTKKIDNKLTRAEEARKARAAEKAAAAAKAREEAAALAAQQAEEEAKAKAAAEGSEAPEAEVSAEETAPAEAEAPAEDAAPADDTVAE